MSEQLKARYEQMRQQCIKQGNLHPDSQDVCHVAIRRAARGLEYPLAALLDDMYLYLSQSEHVQLHPNEIRRRAYERAAQVCDKKGELWGSDAFFSLGREIRALSNEPVKKG